MAFQLILCSLLAFSIPLHYHFEKKDDAILTKWLQIEAHPNTVTASVIGQKLHNTTALEKHHQSKQKAQYTFYEEILEHLSGWSSLPDLTR